MTTDTEKVQPQEEVSEESLMEKLNSALASKDFKAVTEASKQLVKFQRDREQAELEARQKVLAEKTEKVKNAIQRALKPLIDGKELDEADGIWFSQDFGEKMVSCRLMKNAPRKTGGGGGGGKKFAVKTAELLEKYGSQEYKDGVSYQQAWDSNPDKNWRFAIRESLLKLDGQL